MDKISHWNSPSVDSFRVKIPHHHHHQHYHQHHRNGSMQHHNNQKFYKPNVHNSNHTQNKPYRQLILLDLAPHLRSIDALADRFKPYGKVYGIQVLRPSDFNTLSIDAKKHLGANITNAPYGALIEFETARTAKFCCGVLRKRVAEQGFRVAVLKPGAEAELLTQQKTLEQKLTDEDSSAAITSSASSSSSSSVASSSGPNSPRSPVKVPRPERSSVETGSFSSSSNSSTNRIRHRSNGSNHSGSTKKYSLLPRNGQIKGLDSAASLLIGQRRLKAQQKQQQENYKNNIQYPEYCGPLSFNCGPKQVNKSSIECAYQSYFSSSSSSSPPQVGNGRPGNPGNTHLAPGYGRPAAKTTATPREEAMNGLQFNMTNLFLNDLNKVNDGYQSRFRNDYRFNGFNNGALSNNTCIPENTSNGNLNSIYPKQIQFQYGSNQQQQTNQVNHHEQQQQKTLNFNQQQQRQQQQSSHQQATYSKQHFNYW